ncbi:MAG: recombination protein NinB, partial [Zoogloeaceae bacterium]|nr:recombination protein NinB [Zoogloeaceae bacterium]
MDKRVFYLVHAEARRRALECVSAALEGYRVMVSPPGRNLDQNAKFHAICSDLARSGLVWAWKKRNAQEWKLLLVSGHAKATNAPVDFVPGLEGEFVNLRESTAAMSTKRMASLIEYSLAFCALKGVELRD